LALFSKEGAAPALDENSFLKRALYQGLASVVPQIRPTEFVGGFRP
jgi:hypothetical protein